MRIEYGHRTHQECSYCHFEIARKVEKHMYSIHANPAHRIYDERQDWLCYVDLCWRVANGDTQCCLIPRSELTRTHRHTRVRKVSSANHFYSTLHSIWIECLIKNIFGRNYSRFLRHSWIWEQKILDLKIKPAIIIYKQMPTEHTEFLEYPKIVRLYWLGVNGGQLHGSPFAAIFTPIYNAKTSSKRLDIDVYYKGICRVVGVHSCEWVYVD